MVVDDTLDVILSLQCITVPLRPSVTALTSNLDIRGKLFGDEILENVNTVESIVKLEFCIS